MLATRGSGKVTTMEARANKTKGIRCLERTLLGQSTRKHMLDLYLCETSTNFTIMERALHRGEKNITADQKKAPFVLNATSTMMVPMGTTGMIARSKITKTMKTKLEVLENVEWCMPLEEEKPKQDLTT
ncbi:hypothetical protein Tco_1492097 [Tanacetum coccineum]